MLYYIKVTVILLGLRYFNDFKQLGYVMVML